MKKFIILTLALLFMMCSESPVESPELTLIQKYTKMLTRTGCWVWDVSPVYFNFNIDGTGTITVLRPNTDPTIIPYEWILLEEDEKIYLNAKSLFILEIISLSNDEMILMNQTQNNRIFTYNYQQLPPTL